MDPSSDPEKKKKNGGCCRRDDETDNPFVAFRRYADSQISSLLQSVIGLPSLFSHPDPSRSWSSVDEHLARRKELLRAPHATAVADDHDGPRGQQNDAKWAGHHTDRTEALLQWLEGNRLEARRQAEMYKWGALESDCPAKEGSYTTDPATCTHPGKSLTVGWDGKQRSYMRESNYTGLTTARDEEFIMYDEEGSTRYRRVVDKQGEGQGFWTAGAQEVDSKNDPEHDPFKRPGQAINWLLSNEYSPLHLDRTLSYQLASSWYQVDHTDPYFRADYQERDIYPQFVSSPRRPDDPRLATKLDWRAAFRDLLDTHHKGYMASSSPHEEYITPGETGSGWWLHHLIRAGSLGPQWQTLTIPETTSQPFRFRFPAQPNTWAVLPLTGPLFIRQAGRSVQLPEIDREPLQADFKNNVASWVDSQPLSLQLSNSQEDGQSDPISYRPELVKAAISLLQDPGTGQQALRVIDRVLRMIENTDLEDEVENILSSVFEGREQPSGESPKLQSLIEDVDKSLRKGYSELWRAAKATVESEHPDIYGFHFDESTSDMSEDVNGNTSGPTPSKSSTAGIGELNKASPSSPIIQALTTIETHTRPDGTREITRTLKKIFADGREESKVTTESHDEGRSRPIVASEGLGGSFDPTPGTSPEGPGHDRTPQSGGKRNGWFWR